jgi:uroporphyrinogen-III synthase
MSSEMGSLIERHGGVPYSAPVMQEIYSEDSPEVRQLIVDACAGRVDALLLLTGVGTQALVQTAASMGREQEFLQSLEGVTVIARSPKPARVLRQHQIHIDLMPPEPYTSADLLASLGDLDLNGKTVAIQRYGGPNNFLVQSLAERGAQVREVTLYTWGMPEDVTPVLGLIEDLILGKVDALAFTSQPQVGNLLAIAQEADQTESLMQCLRGPVVVASVGPVCSRRLREAELVVDVEPEHPHMGNLVLAVADYFQSGQLAVG